MNFRVYKVDFTGRIQAAEAIDAANEVEARQRAAELARTNPVELWQRAKLVAAIPAASPP